MTYLPVNARSELMASTKLSGGWVAESSFMFSIAVCASYLPARSPTRGSRVCPISAATGAATASERMRERSFIGRWGDGGGCSIRFAEGDGEQHLVHAGDFRRLIDVDIRRDLEDGLVLTGARRGKQGLHHADGAGMVLDHVLEKKQIELWSARRIELGELLAGQHSRHEHVVLHAAHVHRHPVGIWHR